MAETMLYISFLMYGSILATMFVLIYYIPKIYKVLSELKQQLDDREQKQVIRVDKKTT